MPGLGRACLLSPSSVLCIPVDAQQRRGAVIAEAKKVLTSVTPHTGLPSLLMIATVSLRDLCLAQCSAYSLCLSHAAALNVSKSGTGQLLSAVLHRGAGNAESPHISYTFDCRTGRRSAAVRWRAPPRTATALHERAQHPAWDCTTPTYP
jgi:hypothetical protein